jgi:E1A-binding protein p400
MGEMSDDSEGYMSEGSDEGEQQETNHTCTTVALSPASEKQNVDENLDVDGAMERLEKADMQARSIHVDFPFILSKKLSLREYQHVGLNWLVSLHERRLNGILADGKSGGIQCFLCVACIFC